MYNISKQRETARKQKQDCEDADYFAAENKRLKAQVDEEKARIKSLEAEKEILQQTVDKNTAKFTSIMSTLISP